MAKIKYNRTKGLATVSKKSKPISSVAGESYEKLHPYIYREIQKKNREYAEALRQAGNIRINGDISNGRLEPQIENAIGEMKGLCVSAGIPYEFDGDRIDLFRDLFPFCLTVPEELEPRAQRIDIQEGTAVSRKLSNILFHPADMLELLCNSMLFSLQLKESTVLAIIASAIMLVCEIYRGSAVELDGTCAQVLLCLYQSGYSHLGMDEEALTEAVIERDGSLEQSDVFRAVNKLAKYRCISIVDGKVFLVETIGL